MLGPLLTVHFSNFGIICDLQKRSRNSAEFLYTLHPASSWVALSITENICQNLKIKKSSFLQCYSLKCRTDWNFISFPTNEFFLLAIVSRIPHSLSWFVDLLLIYWRSLYIKDPIFCPLSRWQSIFPFPFSLCRGESGIP